MSDTPESMVKRGPLTEGQVAAMTATVKPFAELLERRRKAEENAERARRLLQGGDDAA